MNLTETTLAGSIEILANDHYVAVPLKLTANAKAGAPIASTGGAATESDCAGILLHDVDITKNPNGTIVVHGFINKTKAEASSGVDITAAMAALMPLVKVI